MSDEPTQTIVPIIEETIAEKERFDKLIVEAREEKDRLIKILKTMREFKRLYSAEFPDVLTVVLDMRKDYDPHACIPIVKNFPDVPLAVDQSLKN